MSETTDRALDRARGLVRAQHDIPAPAAAIAAGDGARIMRAGGRTIFVHQHIALWSDLVAGELEAVIEHVEAEGWRLENLSQSSTTTVADRIFFTLVFRCT